jgi:hypothetical protein
MIVTDLSVLSILLGNRIVHGRGRIALHHCQWMVSVPVRIEGTLSAAVLRGASAEMRTWDVPDVDDLSGSGQQSALLVELAVGADHGDSSQDVFWHLSSVHRLIE